MGWCGLVALVSGVVLFVDFWCELAENLSSFGTTPDLWIKPICTASTTALGRTPGCVRQVGYSVTFHTALRRLVVGFSLQWLLDEPRLWFWMAKQQLHSTCSSTKFKSSKRVLIGQVG